MFWIRLDVTQGCGAQVTGYVLASRVETKSVREFWLVGIFTPQRLRWTLYNALGFCTWKKGLTPMDIKRYKRYKKKMQMLMYSSDQDASWIMPRDHMIHVLHDLHLSFFKPHTTASSKTYHNLGITLGTQRTGFFNQAGIRLPTLRADN
jgi:hypothetical protein